MAPLHPLQAARALPAILDAHVEETPVVARTAAARCFRRAARLAAQRHQNRGGQERSLWRGFRTRALIGEGGEALRINLSPSMRGPFVSGEWRKRPVPAPLPIPQHRAHQAPCLWPLRGGITR